MLSLTRPVIAQPDSVVIKHYTLGEYYQCNAICETDDGGFLLAGNDGNGQSLRILKTDQNGDSLWSVLGPDCRICKTIIKTEDGGFIFAGYVSVGHETGWNDLILFRLDENGETVWSRTYGAGIHESEHCYDMVQTQAGGYALAGFTHTYDGSNYDLLLLVTDENGDSLWCRTYKVPERNTMLQMDDGGYLLAGRGSLLRTNENGDSLWSTTPSLDFNDLLRAEDGNIIAFGRSSDTENRTSRIVKLDQNCDTLWSKSCGNFGYEATIIETEDHGFLVTDEQAGSVVAIRTNENGDSLWASSYYGGHAGSNTVIKTSEGGFAFGGYLETSTTMDFLFIKSSDEPFSIENPFDPPPGIVGQGNQLPTSEMLLATYPNPFNASTTIRYNLPNAGWTRMDVMDLNGRLVKRLVDERTQQAGSYAINWDAGEIGAGVYVVWMVAGGRVAGMKVVVIR